MGLEAVATTLAEANAFVGILHRHHKPATGHRWSLGCTLDGKLVGVCIVGRPVARKTDQYAVAEVLRLCTDGTRNACSFLYARAARAAEALGYWKIQTFILEEESGVSLRAAAWECEGLVKPPRFGWNTRKGRKRDQPQGNKVRWSRVFK